LNNDLEIEGDERILGIGAMILAGEGAKNQFPQDNR
jgi:hypothetical protein